jgi:hypothetical protein
MGRNPTHEAPRAHRSGRRSGSRSRAGGRHADGSGGAPARVGLSAVTSGAAGCGPHPTQRGLAAASLPERVDLTRYAISPGDKGQVNSCSAWATAYTALGYWERRDNLPAPGGSEPMYTLLADQPTGGRTAEAASTRTSTSRCHRALTNAPTYFQGDFDWSDEPSASEIASAAQWKLTGYPDMGTDRASIEAAPAQGTPVVISIPVYRDFYAVRSGNGGPIRMNRTGGRSRAGTR